MTAMLDMPSADEARAERMYPNSTPAPAKGQAMSEAQPEAAPVQPDREPTEAQHIAARRQGEARELWAATDGTYRDADLPSVFNGDNPDAQRSAAVELGEIFLDIGAEASDARIIANAMRSQRRFSRAETERGVAGLTSEQLQGARRLAGRDGRLLKVLKATGADGNPEVIKVLARLSGTVRGMRR